MSTNVKLRLRFDIHLAFTWHSPDIHLTFTWCSPDVHLTFWWVGGWLGGLVVGSTQNRPYLRVVSWPFVNLSRSYKAVREHPELDNIFLADLQRSIGLPFLVSALLRFWKGSYWLNHDAYNFFSVPCALLNMFLVDLMRSALLSLSLSTYSIWLAERA